MGTRKPKGAAGLRHVSGQSPDEQAVPVLPQLGADPNTVKFSRGSRWRLSRDAELHVLNVLMPNEMHTTPHDAGKEPCFILCKRKKIPVPSLFGMLHACTLRAVKKSWHKYVEEAVTRHYGDLTDLTLYHLNVEALQKHIGSIALYCRGTTLIESYNWTEKVRVTITADFEECPPESEFEAAEVDPKWLLVRLTEFGSPHHVTDMYYSWDFFSNLNDANPALSNMENTQWVHESETDILTPVTEGDTWAHEMKHLPNASQLSTPGLIWLMARLVKPGTISDKK